MTKKTILLNLAWIFPVSLGTAAGLSAFSGGSWWIGWLGYSLILLLGLSALTALWRWACAEQDCSRAASRTLGLMLLLAVFLRLGIGIALMTLLPVYGYNRPVDQAGYVFRDAYNRDQQAWQLASSTEPIWKAFDKTYSTDQYGGLLAFSALVYRGLSPDFHRPWLMVLIAALTAGIGVALVWKAAQRAWGEALAVPAAWILALFPESLLLGSSPMREPFLIAFVAMLFWGIIDWQSDHHPWAWAWMAGALAGMLAVSPGIVIFALPGLGVWAWLRSRNWRIPWKPVLIGTGVLAAAVVLLQLGLARGQFAAASPFQILTRWLPGTANWDTFVQEQHSGWLQRIFHELPKSLHLPFMTGYGLTQPLLPAALFDLAPWPWKTITILLALGWYALLPFLVFGLVAVWKVSEKNERRAWIWLWVLSWAWILLSSLRAGGDQWDNPRYRAWFLILQALLAAQALVWWRRAHNPWMGRILAIEAVFLVFFSIWYSSRYGTWANQPLHVFIIIAAVLLVSSLILIVGWLQDRLRKNNRKRA